MLPPLLFTFLASALRCHASERSGARTLKQAIRLLAVLSVSPALVLGPCYGQAMISLPTGIGAAISDSLLPDHSERRVTAGQPKEDEQVVWAPIVSSWGWSDLNPAWCPVGEATALKTFLAFWETSASVFPSETVSPLMPVPLATEAEDGDAATGGASGKVSSGVDIDPEFAPADQNEEDWVPAEAEGAPAAEASEPVSGGGPINPLLLGQPVGECTVMGEVSDKTTLDPIEGAIITIGGTGREDETDAQGRFRIDGIPQGTYTVEALKLGYSMGSASASPRPETPAEIRIALTVKPSDSGNSEFMLAEEVVVGEYTETNQGDFNLDIASGLSLSSGLSSEDFAKENVSDAGEAVGKVSGANIVDGKFAVVRGLADRYVTTTFNGGQLSSSTPSRKAVELDLFPTSAISGINVAKTYSPQLFGDFGGAAIDIASRFFPKEQVISVQAKWKYNPDLPSDFRTVPGENLGFFGKLNTGLIPGKYSTVDPVTGAIRLTEAPPSEAVGAWNRLDSTRTLVPGTSSPEDEISYKFTVGDTVDVNDNLEIGYLVAGGQKSGSAYNESAQYRVPDRSWDQKTYQEFSEWDFYSSIGARFNDRHEIRAVYFRKHAAELNARLGTNVRNPEGRIAYGLDGASDLAQTRPFYGADAEVLGGFYQVEPLERDLTIFQIQAESQMGERGPKIRWSFTDSVAEENRPNSTFSEYTTLDFDSPALARAAESGMNEIISRAENATGMDPGSIGSYDEARQIFIDNGAEAFLLQLEDQLIPVTDPSLGRIDTYAVGRYVGAAGPGSRATRAVQSIREETQDNMLAIDFPYYFDDDSEDRGFEFGIGAQETNRFRQNRGNLYELVYEDLDASGDSRGGFDIDDFYPSGDDNGNGLTDLGTKLFDQPVSPYFTGDRATGPYYQDGSIGTDNFLGLISNNADSTHDFSAGYLSGQFFWNDFYFRGGVRYESELRDARFLEPKPTGQLDPLPIEEEVWLPSVNLGTKVFDGRLSLFAAWSRTVARPTFYEWVPTRSFDLSAGQFRAGNAALVNSGVTNFDLSAEYELAPERTIRLSLFHKNITDPIVEVRVPGVADTITYINGDSGQLGGLELEADIGDLGPFSIRGNLTYISADLSYQFDTGTPVTVRFPYQPEWIFNLNLGYENEEHDFGVNLIYNFTGEYATLLRTQESDPDTILESQQTLDLVVRKGFETDWGGYAVVSAGIENLVGTDRVFRYSGGPPSQDGRIRNVISRDRLYFAELKYEF